jgi:hypothetical protein
MAYPNAEHGSLERIFHVLWEEQVTDKRITAVSLDSSSVKYILTLPGH